MVRTWLRQLLSSKNHSRPARRTPRSVRPGVEFLETREVPSATAGLTGGGSVGDPPDSGDRPANTARHTNTVTSTVYHEEGVTSLSVTQGDVNQPYTGTVANFGRASAEFTRASGLPPGLSASMSGNTITLSGTPTQSGSFSVSLETDAQNGNNLYSYEGTYNLRINPALSLGGLSAAAWTSQRAGSATIPVSGGTPAYSHLAVTGLPAGLTAELSGNKLTVRGTPTEYGTFGNVAVSLQDGTGATVHRTYSLTVAPLLGALSAETAGHSYRATFQVAGGSGHYSYTLASGTLPQGLSLSSAGVLSGTATRAGSYPFTVRATDTANPSATFSEAYTLTVNPDVASRLTYLTAPPSSVPVNSLFQTVVQATDGNGNVVSGVAVTMASPAIDTGLSTTTITTDATGQASFSLWSRSVPGAYTLTASAPRIAPIASAFTVVQPLPSNLAIGLSTNQATAGISFHVTITATDNAHHMSDYSGYVWLRSSDAQALTVTDRNGHAVTPPGTVRLSHGQGEADVTLDRPGTVTLSAGLTFFTLGTSDAITVSPGVATHFDVTPAVTSASGGTPFTLTITARDAKGNTATGFGSTVALSSSDGQVLTVTGSDGHALPPSMIPLSNGTVTISVTVGPPTSGDLTFTATSGGLSGTSRSVHFLPHAAFAQVTDATGHTLVLDTDATVWEQRPGDPSWYPVEDSVSKLVSDANGNAFTLDWYGNLNQLTSHDVWTKVRDKVTSLVRDSAGNVFTLNYDDNRVYRFDGSGWLQVRSDFHVQAMVTDAAGNVYVQAYGIDGSYAIMVHQLGNYGPNGYGGGWIPLGGQGHFHLWSPLGTNLIASSGGNVFVLDPNQHTLYQINSNPASAWTPILDHVTCFAATPNGTLLAGRLFGNNDPRNGIWASTTGQSGTWQLSDQEGQGTFAIAVTPNGVVYALPNAKDLRVSTTGLPGSWRAASFYTPDGRKVTAGASTGTPPSIAGGPSVDNHVDVLGLANGRDGQVYFFAGGNVYQVLADGILTAVRAQVSTPNGTSFDSALDNADAHRVLVKTSSYLSQVDGTVQSITGLAQEVGRLINATVHTDMRTDLYNAANGAKEVADLGKDVVSAYRSPGLSSVIQVVADVAGDGSSDQTVQIIVDVVNIVLDVVAIAAC